SGTGAGNVIPASADIRFNFRYSNMVTAEQLQERVHKILDKHKLRYQIECRAMGNPFLTPPGLLTATAQKVIFDITGKLPKLDTGGGTSDGRFIAPKGAQVIEFGPLNATIHKVNECVALTDLELLVCVYKGIMQALLDCST
ncbi:MAG: M20/M25/M40 family metallo-hydrolase, partial [Patescibacteria group bacterium]|nr:M20/M25/M40 family metallo-hydrolase [Patescibacteria group bacterium]